MRVLKHYNEGWIVTKSCFRISFWLTQTLISDLLLLVIVHRDYIHCNYLIQVTGARLHNWKAHYKIEILLFLQLFFIVYYSCEFLSYLNYINLHKFISWKLQLHKISTFGRQNVKIFKNLKTSLDQILNRCKKYLTNLSAQDAINTKWSLAKQNITRLK